jgi:hypothetical protein
MNLQITGAGSSGQTNAALNIDYLAGWTGAAFSTGIRSINANAGTGTTIVSAAAGNFGASGQASGSTTGANVGLRGNGLNGSSGRAVGVMGAAGVAAAGTGPKIGVLAAGIDAAGYVTAGLYAGISAVTAGTDFDAPTIVDSAVIVNNFASGKDLIHGQANSVDNWVLGGTGIVSSGASLFTMEFSGVKTAITEASAISIVRIGLPASTNVYGATVSYTVYDINGANYVARTGSTKVQGGNSSGTVTCTINTTQDQETEDGSQIATSNAATLTYTWTNAVTTTNCDLQINAASSEGVNTFAVAYKVVLTGNATGITITAQ